MKKNGIIFTGLPNVYGTYDLATGKLLNRIDGNLNKDTQ